MIGLDPKLKMALSIAGIIVSLSMFACIAKQCVRNCREDQERYRREKRIAKYRQQMHRVDSTEQEEDEIGNDVMAHGASSAPPASGRDYVGFNVASCQDEDPSIIIDKRGDQRGRLVEPSPSDFIGNGSRRRSKERDQVIELEMSDIHANNEVNGIQEEEVADIDLDDDSMRKDQ